MKNAVSTGLADVEQNQNVLPPDIDVLDDDFTKMTDFFAQM